MVSRTEPWMVVHENPWVVVDDHEGTESATGCVQLEEKSQKMFSCESSQSASVCSESRNRTEHEAETEDDTRDKPIFAPELPCPEHDVIIRPRHPSGSKSKLEQLLLGETRCFDVESLGSRSEVVSEIDANSCCGEYFVTKSEESLAAFLIKQLHQARADAPQRASDPLKTCLAQINAVNAQAGSDRRGDAVKGLLGNCIVTASIALLLYLLSTGKDVKIMRRIFRLLRPTLAADLSFGFFLDSMDSAPDIMGYTPL